VDFFELGKLTFEKPDLDTFSGLSLAYKVAEQGGSMPTVYNAANELAVAKFLNKEIRYLEIVELIEAAVKNHKKVQNPSVSEILNIELETYDFIKSITKK